MSSWTGAVARLIEATQRPQMPGALADLIRHVAPVDFIVMFGYVGVARPQTLFQDFTPERKKLHVDDYVAGPFLLDPFFLAAFDPARTGLLRMSDVAPDRFFQGEYYGSYYKQAGLAEEIAYLVDIDGTSVVVVSLMRLEKRFSAAEFRRLDDLWPIVAAACRRQWATLGQGAGGPHANGAGREMAHACRRLGNGALTDREAEVAALTLQGHSTAAVGTMLGIAPGTARIHRQNIYAKLRIGSQAELFAAFRDMMLTPADQPSSPAVAPASVEAMYRRVK